MHIVITGGAGFIGVRLARHLLAARQLALAGGPAQPITRLTLVDRAAPPPDLADHPLVRVVVGDLLAQLQDRADQVVPEGTDAVVHLAAAVSGECEADLDLGLRSNLDSTRALLQRCRALGTPPVFVYSSSLAVYGHTPELPLPAVVTDTTLPTPQNSYGCQKLMGELLVADYGRKGLVLARNVRLMTVSVRPGRPNGAASSFLSGMVREPLAGQRAVCPVPPDTRVALSSPARAIEGLVKALVVAPEVWGSRTALNLPALTTTPAEMAAALRRVAGAAVADRIDWVVDPVVAGIVTRWPQQLLTERAAALGLRPDASFEAVIRDYVRENPEALAQPVSP